jgi:precorrin-2 C20-methyltransferase/precorrin-3B C17-methyltransferase
MAGRLYGVGVGPGDPELITVKAAKLISSADVVAYHSGTAGRSIARSVVADLINPDAIEELLIYPVTTGDTTHPLGYHGAIADFYDESAERLEKHLDAGRTVVVLAEGDPLFYSSYMYLHDRLAARFDCQVVPGVTSMTAAAASIGLPLARHEEVLTVLPGTLPVPELARRLSNPDAAVIMKLGRTFAGVREALRQAGRLESARYVERASTGAERTCRVVDVDPASVPYFSMIIVPASQPAETVQLPDETVGRLTGLATIPAIRRQFSEGAREVRAEPAADPTKSSRVRLLVLGLGPGPAEWITPEVSAALADVDHVVGYGPYLDRIPARPGLQRHASGNTVELDRARLALDLALRGERVAVASGGDAGVFGMAAAVFEVAAAGPYEDVQITVLPGVTAAQAVAARVGAPLGGDYATLSLSDRLKPWPVIEHRLRAIAAADLVLAIYNPGSRSRSHQVADAQQVLLQIRDPETPVVIGRQVGRPDEEVVITTLGDFNPDTIDMGCLIIVGSSQTRLTPYGTVWTPRQSLPVRTTVP